MCSLFYTESPNFIFNLTKKSLCLKMKPLCPKYIFFKWRWDLIFEYIMIIQFKSSLYYIEQYVLKACVICMKLALASCNWMCCKALSCLFANCFSPEKYYYTILLYKQLYTNYVCMLLIFQQQTDLNLIRFEFIFAWKNSYLILSY